MTKRRHGSKGLFGRDADELMANAEVHKLHSVCEAKTCKESQAMAIDCLETHAKSVCHFLAGHVAAHHH